ncbi:MAG: aspartyl protease family protein [Planctomycetota bacterium]
MKKKTIVIGLAFILASSLLLLAKEGEKASAQGTKIECDVKDVQNFYHCDACGKLLRGFKCPVCKDGKCDWCKQAMAKIASLTQSVATKTQQPSQAQKDALRNAQKEFNEHKGKCCEINELKDFKCPCCGAPLKSLEETDLVVKSKCQFCQSDKIKQKEYCVKWIYDCPDHKGILLSTKYNNTCPELVDDGKGKKKECKKPLELVAVSIEEVIDKYICPECGETSDKPGKCSKCNKDLTKIKTCEKPGASPTIDRAESKMECTFELVSNLTFVQAKVNGREESFILDSGAPTLVLNERYSKSDNPGGSAGAVSGSASYQKIRIKQFEWMKIKLMDYDAIAMNIEQLEMATGKKIFGLIGYQQIKDYVLQIDYKEKELVLLETIGAKTDFSAVIPFEQKVHIPIVTAKIGNKQFRFGIDTGAETNLLDLPAEKKIDEEEFKSRDTAKLIGANQGETAVKMAQLKELIIDTKVFKDMKFVIQDISHLNQGYGLNIDGLLGLPFLSYQKTSIDFPNRKIYLWK